MIEVTLNPAAITITLEPSETARILVTVPEPIVTLDPGESKEMLVTVEVT